MEGILRQLSCNYNPRRKVLSVFAQDSKDGDLVNIANIYALDPNFDLRCAENGIHPAYAKHFISHFTLF